MRDAEVIRSAIESTMECLESLMDDERVGLILQASTAITDSIRKGNKLMICGNGGSAADAQHLAGEFMCRFLKNREPLPAVALTTDSSVLTSISNDYSYADVFERQVRALGKEGDVLLGISTSGNSVNVLNALAEAGRRGIGTILLTGETQTAGGLADLVITVPSTNTPRIQEAHLLIEHVIAELVEQELCKDD
ncbi:MAG: SIS domain-containing protein [Syntrophorhabdus sp.]|nr:SIS domain-containing protein [Syntrophorhabdus sp.]